MKEELRELVCESTEWLLYDIIIIINNDPRTSGAAKPFVPDFWMCCSSFKKSQSISLAVRRLSASTKLAAKKREECYNICGLMKRKIERSAIMSSVNRKINMSKVKVFSFKNCLFENSLKVLVVKFSWTRFLINKLEIS